MYIFAYICICMYHFTKLQQLFYYVFLLLQYNPAAKKKILLPYNFYLIELILR